MLTYLANGKKEFLGQKINEKVDCLYLALEDEERRIKDRSIKQNLPAPVSGLNIACRWSTNNTGINEIRGYLKEYPNTKIICIDTFSVFSLDENATNYKDEYGTMKKYHSLAHELGIVLLLVTHRRKAISETDDFETIYGTNALTGASDTVIMLRKVSRNSNQGELKLISRDMPDFQLNLSFNGANCTWETGNNQIDINLTPERQVILNALKQLGGTAYPNEIAKIVGKTPTNTSNMLNQMKRYGYVSKGEVYGQWTLVNNK